MARINGNVLAGGGDTVSPYVTVGIVFLIGE